MAPQRALDRFDPGVTPNEVEQVFDNEPVWYRNKRSGSGDWVMLGRTGGGRLLTIIVAWNEAERLVRPITGWDAMTRDWTQYRKSRPGR